MTEHEKVELELAAERKELRAWRLWSAAGLLIALSGVLILWIAGVL